MIEIASSVEIDRDAATVFAYVADFENNPTWQRGMRAASWTSEPPIRVGSTYDQVARFLGREIRTSFKVTAFEPERSITIVSSAGSFPITVTRTIEPLGPQRCRATALVTGDGASFLRIADPVARFMVRRSVDSDYARLKQLLEQP